MKKIRKILNIFLVVVMFITALPLQAEAKSKVVYDEAWKLSANVGKDGVVTIGWEKRNDVTRYVVYRKQNKSLKSGKTKKIATLSGDKNSVVDKNAKKGTRYEYTIKGYTGKKLVYKSKALGVNTSTGIITGHYDFLPSYTEEFGVKYAFMIGISYENDAMIDIDGVEIYRKIKGGRYKKIKPEISEKRNGYGQIIQVNFHDKNVKHHKTYTYKARTYIKVDGKKVYSKFSKAYSVDTMFKEPELDIKMLTKGGKHTKEIIMKVQSIDKRNADVVTLKKVIDEEGYFVMQAYPKWGVYDACLQGKSVGETGVFLNISEYSYDNVKWKKFTEKDSFKIKPLKTIYLKFQREDGSEFKLNTNDKTLKLCFGIEPQISYTEWQGIEYKVKKKTHFMSGLDAD